VSRGFCLLKTASNAPKIITLVIKDDFFSGEGPAPSTTPYPLDAYGASPLLAGIINMPLQINDIDQARRVGGVGHWTAAERSTS